MFDKKKFDKNQYLLKKELKKAEAYMNNQLN